MDEGRRAAGQGLSRFNAYSFHVGVWPEGSRSGVGPETLISPELPLSAAAAAPRSHREGQCPVGGILGWTPSTTFASSPLGPSRQETRAPPFRDFLGEAEQDARWESAGWPGRPVAETDLQAG